MQNNYIDSLVFLAEETFFMIFIFYDYYVAILLFVEDKLENIEKCKNNFNYILLTILTFLFYVHTPQTIILHNIVWSCAYFKLGIYFKNLSTSICYFLKYHCSGCMVFRGIYVWYLASSLFVIGHL